MLAILLQILIWSISLGALILWPAGTLNYPGAWAFITLFAGGGCTISIWMFRHSPDLLRERMTWPLRREQKPWDRIFLLFFIAGFFAWLSFMGWDAARTGFAAVPPWLQVVGGACLVFHGLVAWWTFHENAFAIPVVKIQKGQRVIDTGPYAIVRHPMYASMLLFLLSLPLLLGSWLGLVFSVLFIFAIAWRTVREEEILCAELDGYEDYVTRVRYRFVPFIW